MSVFKVEVDSCWSDADAQAEFKTEIKNKFNVDGEFHDGSDYYSYWTIWGNEENVKACIEEYFQISCKRQSFDELCAELEDGIQIISE